MLIKNHLIIDPASLPMLYPTQKWNKNSFGGYLLNNIHREDLITGANLQAHKIENREILHNAINNMSSIKFNFNTDIISFIEKDGKILSDLIYDQQLSDSEKYQNYMYIKIGKSLINNHFIFHFKLIGEVESILNHSLLIIKVVT